MPEAWLAQYISGIPGREKDPEERSVRGLDLLACGSTRPGYRGQRPSHLKEECILRQCCMSWTSKSYPSIWVWPRNTQWPKQKFNKVVSPLGLAAKHIENTKLPWWFETLSRFSCSFFFLSWMHTNYVKRAGKIWNYFRGVCLSHWWPNAPSWIECKENSLQRHTFCPGLKSFSHIKL